MSFDEVRLNEWIEQGARGGPGFKTTIITLASGKEQRNSEWLHERGEWNFGYGTMEKEDYREIYDFFRDRRGRARGFRFRDWADYEAANELLGTGNGTRRVFRLIKDYGFYKKRITRPVAGTVTVTVNGQPRTTGWTINNSTGTITFANTEAAIPAVGAQVRASFTFDLPVRFDIDRLDLRMTWENAASFPDIRIVELLEDDDPLEDNPT
jgi:uncharacterized protein (TIGR02217 family)